jgi:A/G-specific adenine glycosylase
MGYNRRALYLKKAAEVVVKSYGGEFPENEAELAKLPGVGIYTARALLVFVFGQEVAAVDTNIRQIITHFFFKDVAQKPAVIQEVADRLVPAGESWEWHQALMDYGALELPKLKVQKRTKTAGTPFKETNRYYRGRVIDALREGNRREQALLHEFHKRYGKPEHFIASLIDGLVGDGLAERKNGILRLPG